MQVADEIQIVLSRVGFALTGFTFLGETALESFSGDKKKY